MRAQSLLPILASLAATSAAAQPANPTAAPVDDAQCLVVAAAGVAILERDPAPLAPAASEGLASLRQALAYYSGRMTAQPPAGGIGPAIAAARRALPRERYRETAAACLERFDLRMRTIREEATQAMRAQPGG
jgi:hypothetical protein